MKKFSKQIVAILVIILVIFGLVSTVSRIRADFSEHTVQIGGEKIDGPFQDKPSEDMSDVPKDGLETTPNDGERPNKIPGDRDDFRKEENLIIPNMNKFDSMEIAKLFLYSVILGIALMYLAMSIKDEKFYKNGDKVVIFILAGVLIGIGFSIGTVYFIENGSEVKRQVGEESSKDEVILNKDNVLEEGTIDLSKESGDVTIKSGGTYKFTGYSNSSIIVDSDEDVRIILEGVEIVNENTAAIIGLSNNKITIELAEGSENFLTDGGNSEYDGCIFSNGELEFVGVGKLTVNGKQNGGEGIATEAANITIESGTLIITSNDDGINAGGNGATITINGGNIYINASGDGIDSNKDAVINGGTLFVMGSDIGGDAGIDTDGGYEINGGTVVALGSDMIEVPKSTSKQKTIVFTFDSAIEKNTIVTLKNDDVSIISFEASKRFRTAIISSESLKEGSYSIYTGGTHSGTISNGIYRGGKYKDGEKITIKNKSEFDVSGTVSSFGGR
ncbi:MAG TPA: hypothetical protein DCY94_04905 [Firmicutes bacterium]|nr:hypothetical protein [Bacillota bacterium]